MQGNTATWRIALFGVENLYSKKKKKSKEAKDTNENKQNETKNNIIYLVKLTSNYCTDPLVDCCAMPAGGRLRSRG